MAVSRRTLLKGGLAAAGLAAVAPATRVGALVFGEEDLNTWVLERMRAAHLPGLGAAIVRRGKVVWSHGWGFADIGRKALVGQDTVFMLASVSKTVTCTGVMQAVEQGHFALDDDINSILSFEVKHPEFPSAKITPRMLLAHTSGLRDNWGVLVPDYVHGDSPLSLGFYMEDYFAKDGSRYDKQKNFQDWKPGAKYTYCNMAVSLAGYLVEAATGIGFAQWCGDHIFHPLGMDQTSWRLAGLDTSKIATPYHYEKPRDRYRPIKQYGYPDYPDGELRASPSQLARFLSAIANGGATADGVRILEPRTIKEIFTDQKVASWRQGLIWYGSGNAITGRLWGHNGGDKGVATYEFFSPSSGDGVVLLANGSWRNAAAGHAYRQIRDRLLANPPA
jgi:CubicO group peptidase (beta-lactamase class C family)